MEFATKACGAMAALVALGACHIVSGLSDFDAGGSGGSTTSTTSAAGGATSSASSSSSGGHGGAGGSGGQGGSRTLPYDCYAGPVQDFEGALDPAWVVNPMPSPIIVGTNGGALEINVPPGAVGNGQQQIVRLFLEGRGDLRTCAFVSELVQVHPQIQEWGVAMENSRVSGNDHIYFRVSGQQLLLVVDPAGTSNRQVIDTMPYVPEQHRWFAIAIDGNDDIVWATSPDGYNYTRYGLDVPFSFETSVVRSAAMFLQVNDDTAGAARWEHFNLNP